MSTFFTRARIQQIQQLAIEADSFAYLVLDHHGGLLEMGGALSSLELPAWKIGENIPDQAMFLHGSLPLASDHESIICYQLTDSCAIDIHLFRDEAGTLILLIDRSIETGEEARTRQQRNAARLKERFSKPRLGSKP